MKTQKKTSDTESKKIYTFAQRDGDDFSCVKLIEGKYSGIIYKYERVGFAKEENPDGTLPMKFDFTILRNENKVDIDLEENKQEFINTIGDILIELIEDQINNGTVVYDRK